MGGSTPIIVAVDKPKPRSGLRAMAVIEELAADETSENTTIEDGNYIS